MSSQPPRVATLTINHSGESLALCAGINVIGSSYASHVRIDDDSIESQHAYIKIGTHIIDNNITVLPRAVTLTLKNEGDAVVRFDGITYNCEHSIPVLITHNQVILLGSVECTFTIDNTVHEPIHDETQASSQSAKEQLNKSSTIINDEVTQSNHHHTDTQQVQPATYGNNHYKSTHNSTLFKLGVKTASQEFDEVAGKNTSDESVGIVGSTIESENTTDCSESNDCQTFIADQLNNDIHLINNQPNIKLPLMESPVTALIDSSEQVTDDEDEHNVDTMKPPNNTITNKPIDTVMLTHNNNSTCVEGSDAAVDVDDDVRAKQKQSNQLSKKRNRILDNDDNDGISTDTVKHASKRTSTTKVPQRRNQLTKTLNSDVNSSNHKNEQVTQSLSSTPLQTSTDNQMCHQSVSQPTFKKYVLMFTGKNRVCITLQYVIPYHSILYS